MIEKGFLLERMTGSRKNSRTTSIVSGTLFILGSLTLLVSLVYMIMHLDKADKIIWIWLPLIVAGIILILVSQMTRGKLRRIRRK